MATSEIVNTKSKAPVNSAQIYEENAQLIFDIVRFFLPPEATEETIQHIAQKLLKALPEAGYQRYAKFVCLTVVYELLSTHPLVKPPQPLSFLEAFCLLLRDRFQLSCSEIGGVVGNSEGSIRTRLERSRLKMFPLSGADAQEQEIPSFANHLCIRTRQDIEDWNPPSSEEVQIPKEVETSAEICSRCELVLQRKLTSAAHFSDYKEKKLPEALEKLPATPVLVKDGSRVFFNWTAAPWYVKACFEGLLATTLVLGIVLSVPRVKRLYEFWLERRLDLYTVTELAAGIGNSAEAPAESPTADSSAENQKSEKELEKLARTDKLVIKPETEFSNRDSDKPSPDKIYRILIKTDAPETLKDSVLKVLKPIRYEAATQDGASGTELPGGIMFDIYIPLKDYKYLMNTLTTQFEARPIITRSREKKVPNKAHFKIWLQRI